MTKLTKPIRLVLIMCVCVASHACSSSTPNSDNAASLDDPITNLQTSSESDQNSAATTEPENAISGSQSSEFELSEDLLLNLFGASESERAWACNRTDSDGSVQREIVEFGELPEFNRAWIRFISMEGRASGLYRFTVGNEDSLRLTVPGIDRIAPIFQSEPDSRTRFFTVNSLTDNGLMNATFLERRLVEDLLVQYQCIASNHSEIIASSSGQWPAERQWPQTPTIVAVAGLNYSRFVEFGVTDACNDGQTIEVSLYETFNGTFTGHRWPEDPDFTYIAPIAGAYIPLYCSSGTAMCYSANSRGDTDGFWGLSPADAPSERTCTDCCFSCPIGTQRDPNVSFTCNG